MTLIHGAGEALPDATTGRDDYIMSQALIYAIAQIQSLPRDRQEFSNMCDMCAIARTINPGTLALIIYETQRRTNTVIDLWPDNDDHNLRMQNERNAFLAVLDIHLQKVQTMFAKHPLQ